jgi:uncharacterized protein (DUF488 family)
MLSESMAITSEHLSTKEVSYMNLLFTIGHSTHDFSTFLRLLKKHEIDVVADVRSRPHSRMPWFCRPELEKELKANGVRYVFLGDELGARRIEREVYIGPRADYELIARTPAFARGMARLREGVAKFRVALMCAEKDPLDCHRTVLVCRHAKEFADIFHILPGGQLETHADAELRMMRKFVPAEGDMFLSRIDLLNQVYRRRGEEINYVEEN